MIQKQKLNAYKLGNFLYLQYFQKIICERKITMDNQRNSYFNYDSSSDYNGSIWKSKIYAFKPNSRPENEQGEYKVGNEWVKGYKDGETLVITTQNIDTN